MCIQAVCAVIYAHTQTRYLDSSTVHIVNYFYKLILLLESYCTSTMFVEKKMMIKKNSYDNANMGRGLL